MGIVVRHMQSEVERAKTTSSQQVDHGQIITQLQWLSLYHTMVLSAVTHSLVIGRKVRNEDPTADISMVTRPPHHTYTMLVAGLLQTQIQKLL